MTRPGAFQRIEFEHNEQRWRVVFRYQHFPVLNRRYPIGATYCSLQVYSPCEDQPKSWAEQQLSFSRCDSRDRFVRAIGRRRALTRALREAGFPREVRARVWAAYFRVTSDLPRHWSKAARSSDPWPVGPNLEPVVTTLQKQG